MGMVLTLCRCASLVVGLSVFGVSTLAVAGGMGGPSVPGMDEVDSPEIPELPAGAELKMPKPGQGAYAYVSCLQKGNLDLKRPSLPLVSCWESATSDGESAEDLQKACVVQMTPMKIDSALVPKCPSKALGVCIGAKSGSSSGKASLSNHYHYTPQTMSDWRKSKKNCESAGGEWHGLGNPHSWF